MNTDKAICLVDAEFKDGDKIASIHRGKEYTISTPENNEVTVFTNYWFKVPESYFGGVKKFTRDSVKPSVPGEEKK